jgi:hypothetical protein
MPSRSFRNESDYDVIRYAYDHLNRMTLETLLVHTSELRSENLKNVKYDNVYSDRVLSQTPYSYYWNGTLKSKTDAKGNVSVMVYNLDRRLTKKDLGRHVVAIDNWRVEG